MYLEMVILVPDWISSNLISIRKRYEFVGSKKRPSIHEKCQGHTYYTYIRLSNAFSNICLTLYATS